MKKILLMKKMAAFVISAGIAASFTGCGEQNKTFGEVVDTFTLEHCDVENYINVSGTVEGSDKVNITSELSAKIEKLNVSVGTKVKKGDVLCVFDSSDFEAEYESLEKTINKANKKSAKLHEINLRSLEDAKESKNDMLEKAQRAIDRAVKERDNAYDRYNKKSQKLNEYYEKYNEYYNMASESEDETAYEKYQEYLEMYNAAEAELGEFESSLGAYDSAIEDAQEAYDEAEKSADREIQAAQDTIDSEKYEEDDSIQKQLDDLKDKIEKCTVKADRDGIVTMLNVAEGSIPSSESLITIENDKELKINVTINEADILKIKEGQEAVITTSATGKEEFNGVVTKIINIKSEQETSLLMSDNSGVKYSAEIIIDKGESDLLIGMTARGKIILNKVEDVLAVPFDAVYEEEGGSNYIFLADKKNDVGTVKKVSVKKGVEANYLTEISSPELKDGDLVIITGGDYKDGDHVIVSDNTFDEMDNGASYE